jgi:hypothetical protein
MTTPIPRHPTWAEPLCDHAKLGGYDPHDLRRCIRYPGHPGSCVPHNYQHGAPKTLKLYAYRHPRAR